MSSFQILSIFYIQMLLPLWTPSWFSYQDVTFPFLNSALTDASSMALSSLGCYVSFLGVPQQSTTDRWLKEQKFYFLTILKARSLRARHRRVGFFAGPSLLAYRWPCSPRVFTCSFLCVCLGPSLYKDTSHVELGSTLTNPFYLNYFCKGLIAKQWYSEILEVRTSTYNFRGIQFSP